MVHTSIYITIVYLMVEMETREPSCEGAAEVSLLYLQAADGVQEKKLSRGKSFLKIQIYSLSTSQSHLLYSSLKTLNQHFTEFDLKIKKNGDTTTLQQPHDTLLEDSHVGDIKNVLNLSTRF